MGDKDWGSGDIVAADWPCKQTSWWEYLSLLVGVNIRLLMVKYDPTAGIIRKTWPLLLLTWPMEMWRQWLGDYSEVSKSNPNEGGTPWELSFEWLHLALSCLRVERVPIMDQGFPIEKKKKKHGLRVCFIHACSKLDVPFVIGLNQSTHKSI